MKPYIIACLMALVLGQTTLFAWATSSSLVQVEKILGNQQLHLRFKTNQPMQPKLQARGQDVVLEIPHIELDGHLDVLLGLRNQVPPFLPALQEVLLSQTNPQAPHQMMVYLKLHFAKPIQAKLGSQGKTAFDLILAPVGSTGAPPVQPQTASRSTSTLTAPIQRPLTSSPAPTALHWKVKDITARPGIDPLAEYRPVFGNEWRPLLTGQDIADNKQLRTGPGEQVTLRHGKLQVQMLEESIINLAGTDNNRLLLNQGMLAVEGEAQSWQGYRFFGPGYYLVSSDMGPVAFLMSRNFVVALAGQVTIYQNNVLKVIPPGQYLDTQNLNTVPVTEALFQRLMSAQNPALEGWMRRYLNAL